MKLFTLTYQQELPISRTDAWDFFSKPENLVRLTPSEMKMKRVDNDKRAMYPGQVISFKVSPFPGFRPTWVSEITEVNEPEYFVDEQRKGPYAVWRHKHSFTETTSGVLVEDHIQYSLPLGWVGRLLNGVLVRPRIDALFNYRKMKLEELYNNEKSTL